MRLREERKRQGLTLMALAIRTGINPSDLSAVELGRRPAYPGWRRRIAEALQTSEAAVFDPEPPDPTSWGSLHSGTRCGACASQAGSRP